MKLELVKNSGNPPIPPFVLSQAHKKEIRDGINAIVGHSAVIPQPIWERVNAVMLINRVIFFKHLKLIRVDGAALSDSDEYEWAVTAVSNAACEYYERHIGDLSIGDYLTDLTTIVANTKHRCSFP